MNENVEKNLALVRSPSTGVIGYRRAMQELGVELVREQLKDHPPFSDPDQDLPASVKRRFHVVSPLEDFDYLARGVREELRNIGEVSFSCLWTQFRREGPDPRDEVCALYKAYHEPTPEAPYELVVACANVGSTAVLRCMLVHTLFDEKMDGAGKIWIVSPAEHIGARHRIDELRLDVAWATFSIEDELDLQGFSVPGVGGDPNQRAGFNDPVEREHHVPFDVLESIRARREKKRELAKGFGM